MNKQKQLEVLGKIIGINAAHEIMIKFTNKPESVQKMQSEIDNYNDLSIKLAEGNWNSSDLLKIKEIAEDRCRKKLREYKDIKNEKYNFVGNYIEDIMNNLELQ